MRLPSLTVSALFILLSHSAMSYQFDANIKGDNLQWISAIQNSQKLVTPSFWHILENQPVASSVILGGAVSASPQTFQVSLIGGATSLSLSTSIAGVDYRLSSITSSSPDLTNTTHSVSTNIKGAEVNIIGTGIGDTRINLKQLESPILFIRPVLDIKTNEWVSAFKSANAPNGKYKGSFRAKIIYDYIRNNTRIRNILTIPVEITLNYSKQTLSSVEITGSDIMTTRYDYPSLVSAETIYTVKASGYFTNGVSVGLVPLASGELYTLKSSSSDKEIPFDLTCITGCSENINMITKGNALIDNRNNRTKITAVETEVATAQLKVSFNKISQTEISGQDFSGKFILMFEANI